MNFREKTANFIVNARWYFFAIFLALTIASVFLIPKVAINYDLSKYLPDASETKISLQIMEEEFGASGTASVMIENASVEEIGVLTKKLQIIDGISSVIFDPSDTSYYKNNNGLLKVFFDSNNYTVETAKAIDEIKKTCSEYETAISGSAVDASASRNALSNEMVIILGVAVLIVLLILTLTSKSWLEPLVYLCVIGCAIIINMGTNLILGEISFVTHSISTIMLIALEMDYCIVLCSRYREEESKGMPKIEAMKSALAGSFTAIIASSCTVMAGLIALMFMDFSIGFDIGAVLTKGVFISILAVLLFMPSIILIFSKALDKTKHKNFLPKMDKLGSFAHKSRIVVPIVFACLVCASAVIQTGVSFTYYAESTKEGSQTQIEAQMIADNFGKQNTLVVIVPNNDLTEELRLYNEISNIEINGQKYINSKSALVDTPLYTTLTKEQIKETYGLSDDIINNLFTALNKQPQDTLYLNELICYLHENNNIINRIAQSKQQNIDDLYNVFSNMNDNNLYAMLNLSQAQGVYNLSSPMDMQGIYAQILGIEINNVTNQTLPNWAIMEALYSQNIENYQEILAPIFNNQYAPFNKLTASEVHTIYGLPNEVINQIYLSYNLQPTDTIRTLQIVQALNTRKDDITIIEKIALTTQAQIDSGFALSQTAHKMYASDKYHRMIFNLNLDIQDENAKLFIGKLKETINSSTFTKCYITNETNNVLDTEETFKTDRLKTDLITFFGILLIVLLAFRSFSIPLLLVLTIQGAIWINIALNNIAGDSIYFICYLLAMAIQMGATIDYGILLTDRYTKFRKEHSKLESIKFALNSSIATILTSGLILIFAAFTIHFISSTPMISEIGLLIGRGALISVLAILFVLPQLLLLCDKLIEKTTYKAKFFIDKPDVK